MAVLYGRLQGNRGEATRMGTASSGIYAKLETWDGSVVTRLNADGTFTVHIGGKYSANKLIAKGNVDTQELEELDAIEQGA